MAQDNDSQTIASLQEQVIALEEKLAFYELAVKKYPQQIWILDDQGEIILTSESMSNVVSKITNVEIKDFSGINIYQLISEVAPKPFVEMIRRNDSITREGDGTMVFEEVAQIGNEVRTFLSYKKRFVHPTNKRAYLLGMSIDITERKDMESNMLSMMEDMQLAEKTKRTFIQNFRHDLKTPISNIIGAADLMLHGKDTKEIPFFLEAIKSSGLQLMSHIEHLTDISGSKKAVLPLELKPINIRNEINSVTETTRAIARAKKLSVKVSVCESVPKMVVTDQIRIHRILANLLSNALKYTIVGTVTIEVNFINTSQGSVLEIQVLDTGSGIEEKFQQLIFSPMMRITNSQHESEGAGLGLSIVREFVEDLSGQISVKSSLGQGSQFIVMIPILS
ncbi:MAG: PAS domain-containing sensor histidine kinase [Pseudomonadota bacterium]|nr:PAS domain-containing sensor histidine kinase [Pseudomonadota bacterium]